MAVGVYRSSKKPNTEFLDNISAITNPTTTDGIPIKENIVLAKNTSPLNLFSPNFNPKGMKIIEIIVVEIKAAPIERKITSYSSLSKDIIN